MPFAFRILVLSMALLPLETWAAETYVRAGGFADIALRDAINAGDMLSSTCNGPLLDWCAS